jgi:hypothetical protein
MRQLFLSFFLLVLSGCAASIPLVQVTRFHLSTKPMTGNIVIEPAAGTAPESLEFGAYAAAVRREVLRLGYNDSGTPAYRLILSYSRSERTVARQSPVTVGIGGGSSGGGIGVGIGTSFGLGRKTESLVDTRLSVQMKRASDDLVVWEGRAQTEAPDTAPAAQPGLAADKLARALFQDFPGESGRTIRIP